MSNYYKTIVKAKEFNFEEVELSFHQTEIISLSKSILTLETIREAPKEKLEELSKNHPEVLFTVEISDESDYYSTIEVFEVLDGKAKKINELIKYFDVTSKEISEDYLETYKRAVKKAISVFEKIDFNKKNRIQFYPEEIKIDVSENDCRFTFSKLHNEIKLVKFKRKMTFEKWKKDDISTSFLPF